MSGRRRQHAEVAVVVDPGGGGTTAARRPSNSSGARISVSGALRPRLGESRDFIGDQSALSGTARLLAPFGASCDFAVDLRQRRRPQAAYAESKVPFRQRMGCGCNALVPQDCSRRVVLGGATVPSGGLDAEGERTSPSILRPTIPSSASPQLRRARQDFYPGAQS